jgi:tetratricopeptide (TPR) repeat protein
LNDRHADATGNMAAALKQLRRFDKANVFLRRMVDLRPDSAEAMRNLADGLLYAGAVAEAIRSYQESIRLDPRCISARLGLAEACEAAGDFKQAKFQYVAVLRQEPDSPLALAKLLRLRGGATDPAWAAKAEELVGRPDTDSSAQARLNIALGYYYDKIGHFDSAFGRLKSARDEQANRYPFDSDGYSRAIDVLIETLTKDFFQMAETSGVSSDRPLFIVGMPRSGTTLTEQILASHSGVAAGGELSALPSASHRVAELSLGHQPYPFGLKCTSATALQKLAAGYLEQVEKIDPTGRRVTDKLPFNFMHLGLIPLLFPRATIVHCRRQPLDNCVSCYFTSFAEEIQFTNDLYRLGRYYADYDRLMKHWKSVLPIPILDLQYEDLVNDTESAVRGLLFHCGLPWEEACLKFYQTERGIRTPSRWQVRQPIYGNSVARWRHYEKHLEPLKRGLGAARSE